MVRLPGLLGSAVLGAAVLASPVAALAAPPPPPSPAYAPAILSWTAAPTSRVVVRVGPGFDRAAFAAAVRAAGGRTVSIQKGYAVVDLPGGADGPAASGVRAVLGVRGLSAARSHKLPAGSSWR
jgi:hypothetical protein